MRMMSQSARRSPQLATRHSEFPWTQSTAAANIEVALHITRRGKDLVVHFSVHRWRSLRLFAVVACAACTSGEDRTVGPLGIDDGAHAGQKTSLLVTPESEGTLELKTGAKVRVPAGSVDKPVELGLDRPADDEAIELTQSFNADAKIGSAPYIVTPHGSEFKEEVEVTLPVVPERDKSKIVVAYLEDEKDTEWKYLTSPSFIGNYATFTVSHFSVLILVERERSSGGQLPGDGARDAGTTSAEDIDAGAAVRDAGFTHTTPDASSPDADESG